MGIKKSFIKEYIKNKIEVVVDTYRLPNTHQSYSTKKSKKKSKLNFAKKKKISSPRSRLPGISNPLSVSRVSIIFVHLKAFAQQPFTFWVFLGGTLYWRYPGNWTQGLHIFGLNKMSPETIFCKF